MQYRSVKGMSGWGQLGILTAFTAVGLLLGGGVYWLMGMQLLPPGVPAEKMNDEMVKVMLKPENVSYARFAQVVSSFFMLGLPALLYMFVCHGKNTFWLGFNKHINAGQIILGFFLIFLANILATPLEDFSKFILNRLPDLNAMAQQLENAYTDQVTALSNLKSWPEFFMAIVIMAFFPALFEEMFFRGALQTLLERWWKAPLMAVIVASLVFSAIHVSIYLFLSRVLLGFVLGLMYQRSKNLWVNIVAHFLNNTVALIQLFWITQNKEKIEVDKLDLKVPLWGTCIALGITIGLFILFERVSAKNRNQVAFKEQDLLEHSDILHHFPENKNM